MGGVSYCCFATPNKNIMHIIRKVPNVVKNNIHSESSYIVILRHQNERLFVLLEKLIMWL